MSKVVRDRLCAQLAIADDATYNILCQLRLLADGGRNTRFIRSTLSRGNNQGVIFPAQLTEHCCSKEKARSLST